MKDNRLLTALSLLERVEPHLKMDKRDQLTRGGLESIRRFISQATNMIGEVDINMTYALAYLVDACEMINMYLNDPSFMETSTEVKDLIIEKIMMGKDLVYVEVGKFYTVNEFDYNWQMDKFLTRIVDVCIGKGYYFGFDKEKEIIV